MSSLSIPTVEAFQFDDDNTEKFAAHGLTDRQVNQLLGNEFLVVPNRKSRRGSYLLLGTDNGGACIAVPVEPTTESDLWRPITAWRCKDSERNYLERAKRRQNEEGQ